MDNYNEYSPERGWGPVECRTCGERCANDDEFECHWCQADRNRWKRDRERRLKEKYEANFDTSSYDTSYLYDGTGGLND